MESTVVNIGTVRQSKYEIMKMVSDVLFQGDKLCKPKRVEINIKETQGWKEQAFEALEQRSFAVLIAAVVVANKAHKSGREQWRSEGFRKIRDNGLAKDSLVLKFFFDAVSE